MWKPIALILACALALTGCANFKQYLAQDQQYAAAVIQRVAAGVKVAAADIQLVSGVVCSDLSQAQSAFSQLSSFVGQNPGPKTNQNLNIAASALNTVGAYCSSGGGSVQMLLAAYHAAQAAKAAIATAQQSAPARM